jgi:hypothetical protein
LACEAGEKVEGLGKIFGIGACDVTGEDEDVSAAF